MYGFTFVSHELLGIQECFSDSKMTTSSLSDSTIAKILTNTE